MTTPASPFFEQPILNSPYEEPTRHHPLDAEGQPLNEPPRDGRRKSELITPVPKPRKKKRKNASQGQASLALQTGDGLSTEEQEYNPTPIINEIRIHVGEWRRSNPAAWGVTPATARLLNYWRSYQFQGVRPFFCQVEAVETVIWLTEVARNKKQYAHIWEHVLGANEQANFELLRLAAKMATGAGKTTAIAMLIAWQTVNAVRLSNSTHFSRGFLVVAPGITIKDRLRVLLPSDIESYYRARELVPGDMLDDINKAKIVITNYHGLALREILEVNKVGRSLLQGRHAPIATKETEGQMVRRVAEELMGLKNIVVINDEAHHCYREKPDNEDIDDLKGDDKKEAVSENEAARLWISGIEIFKRKLGVRAVYDLSATPFFLRGSGYAEGTLFPWTMSDFSLMDAIECGIVKLPRVPTADNIPEADVPVFRDLWEHIRDDMPKKGRGTGQGELNPAEIAAKLQTALVALYNHYAETFEKWQKSGIDTPPVFIVVCNNTSTSKLVYEWISGWQRPVAEDSEELRTVHHGHLSLFSNFDEHGNRLARPNTLLIDSKQLESGEALDDDFRRAAALEIEQYKREIAQRSGAGEVGELSDSDLLREVMNTVGKKGRLGEQVRCVVSVAMLTEGWDTNTVTHILGVRAFGTQLLCEQVVGRGLRRQSYDLNAEGLFDVEYADIMGIPFDFMAKPPGGPGQSAQEDDARGGGARACVAWKWIFPRVEGYRIDPPEEKLEAKFTPNSKLVLTPDMFGPGQTLLEGIVGEGVTLTVAEMRDKRPSTVSYELAKHFSLFLLQGRWTASRSCTCSIKSSASSGAGSMKAILNARAAPVHGCSKSYPSRRKRRSASITALPPPSATKNASAPLSIPYNPKGSTRYVGIHDEQRPLYRPDPAKSHINYVVCDSDWEAEFARAAEEHPRVLSYVKNQGLGLEVPYKDGATARFYLPDFIVNIDDGYGADDPLHLISRGEAPSPTRTGSSNPKPCTRNGSGGTTILAPMAAGRSWNLMTFSRCRRNSPR